MEDNRDLPMSEYSQEPRPSQERPARTSRWFIGVLWLIGIVSLAGIFGIASRYFDVSERLNQLVAKQRALPLNEWQLQAYQCPSFYAPLESCKELSLNLESKGKGKNNRVQIPLSAEVLERLDTMPERPTLLHLTYKLSAKEKSWIENRSEPANSNWPTQSQLVSLGSFECEAKNAAGNDFNPLLEPENLICTAQNRFERQKPENGILNYYISLGAVGKPVGPTRWPLMMVENQFMHTVMSLDETTSSANIVWNLISLLMPVFVIAFRFVFRNEKTLNTLADYAFAMVIYALLIILMYQSATHSPTLQSMLSTLCILLEGVILTLLVRYAYCMASGSAWRAQSTVLLSIMASLCFIIAFAVSKRSPQVFLITSHQWRDSLGSCLALAAILLGSYNRVRESEHLGRNSHSHFNQASDDFGTPQFFIRIACTSVSLMIFGMSNLRELVSPTMKVIKWEDLQFLPTQTAVVAFFLGIRTSSTLKYGKSMKERLEQLFTGVLNLQRAVTPLEAIESTVKGIREVLPSAVQAEVEFVERSTWATEEIQSHLNLSHHVLTIPLHGSLSYRGLLRFEGVQQENLSEEEEHLISTMANALAVNLENQESNSNLEKMHQASLRFVPHDFLRLLKSESLVEVNLGNHVELRMAVLFADIRNFTQISEGMTPSQSFEFINGFLTQIAPVIKNHGGFIDKYIGDAIMALFPNSSLDALRCAIEMQVALRNFNDRWHGLVHQEIRLGIGIHYGPMILGIVGYAERLSGTVMSDAVNLASRLESLTKKYSTQIIVSEDVLQHMSQAESREFKVHLLDSVTVKGRNSMVTIYEVEVPQEQPQELQSAS